MTKLSLLSFLLLCLVSLWKALIMMLWLRGKLLALNDAKQSKPYSCCQTPGGSVLVTSNTVNSVVVHKLKKPVFVTMVKVNHCTVKIWKADSLRECHLLRCCLLIQYIPTCTDHTWTVRVSKANISYCVKCHKINRKISDNIIITGCWKVGF